MALSLTHRNYVDSCSSINRISEIRFPTKEVSLTIIQVMILFSGQGAELGSGLIECRVIGGYDQQPLHIKLIDTNNRQNLITGVIHQSVVGRLTANI